MRTVAVSAIAVLAFVAAIGARVISPEETARLASAARIVQDIQSTIPADYWTRARCVIVIPDLKKAAFIFGGEYGAGVMSCRSGERWTAPLFMHLAKGSWGFQAGAEQVDLVLLVMNEDGVQKLLANQVTLGADASAAAGPIGGHGAVGTDGKMTAEILSYSRAKGLFAGIDVSGGVLRPDADANAHVYGESATPRTILASHEISAPTEASAFIAALGTASQAPPPSPSTTSTPAPPSASSSPASTGRDEVRTIITQMQQSLDRMLSDSVPSPVGTAGGGRQAAAAPETNGTVTVDRARLVQLRQQLDALSAAIDRR